MENCEWCRFSNGRCPKDETCSFRKIPFEKHGILRTLKEENQRVKDLAGQEGQEKEILDILVGMQVMILALKELGMSEEEILSAIGRKPLSWREKATLLWKLKTEDLTDSRRGKNGRKVGNRSHK